MRSVVRSARSSCGLVLAVATPALAAQSLEWTSFGAARGDRLGESVAVVPDADGDGLPDLLIGAPASDVGFADVNAMPLTGRASLRSGASGAILREFVSDLSGDVFGRRVADVGDVDGDGTHDVAITAPRRPTSGVTPGALFVYSGADGSLLHALVNNSSAYGEYGTDVAGIGDVDGDGCADFVSSNFGFDVVPTNEAVSVVSGKSGATIRTHFGSTPGVISGLGIDVAAAGDVDDDGFCDYVVSAPFETALPPERGVAYVYSGASGALLWTLTDPNHAPGYGWSVSGAGDVDGDGHADVLVAGPDDPSSTGGGIVHVHSGATGVILATVTGAKGDALGTSLSATADLDGDGVVDFVATAQARPAVRLFSGASGSLIRSFDIDTPPDVSVDATADLDGDGVRDAVVGFPDAAASDQLAGAGRCVAIGLASGALLVDVYGVAFQSRLGESMARVADRDGDGHREVAIGLPGGLGSTVGKVRVVSGASGAELALVASGTPGDQFGAALAGVGDLDGDRIDDLAIGAPGFQGTGEVELRSGSDDALLFIIAAPAGAVSFGRVLASVVDAGGGSVLAIGDPDWKSGGKSVGRVEIDDLARGTVVHVDGATSNARFGAAIACVGDADGDGILDWVIGEPDHDSSLEDVGRVLLVAGSDGSTLWSREGSLRREELGTSVAGLDDLDGDGVGEVIAGSPDAWSGRGGRVSLCSGRTGTLLVTIKGGTKNDLFGARVGRLGDLNGDGRSDFAVCAPRAGRVHLYSGGTSGELYRFDLPRGFLPDAYALIDVPHGRDSAIDPDPIPDLVIGFPERSSVDASTGLAELHRLDDLFLRVEPPDPPSGVTATAVTSGAPFGNWAALFSVAVDGVPSFDLVAFGTCDVFGIWTHSGVVPPSLSGHTLTLRSYALGFNSTVVDTQDTVVAFP